MKLPRRTIVTDSDGRIQMIMNIPDSWPEQELPLVTIRTVAEDGTVISTPVLTPDSQFYSYPDMTGEELEEIQLQQTKIRIKEKGGKPRIELELVPGEWVDHPVQMRRDRKKQK